LIDWDSNTARSRASKRSTPVSRLSITLTLIVFVGLALTVWFLLSRDVEPRSIESLDVWALDLEPLREDKRGEISIFRGRNQWGSTSWIVSILYSETMSGADIALTDEFTTVSDWLNEKYKLKSSPLPHRVMRNAVVLCWRPEGCEFVAERLEYFTN